MDGVNRDYPTESRLRELALSAEGGLPHIRHLWAIWMVLHKHDGKKMQYRTYIGISAAIHFADLHFTVMREHREFYDYVRWFVENRLVNTGTGDRMKAELSELYTRNPKKKR